MTFRDLHLIPPILQAAAEAGYQTPSPIQQQAIPPVLAGRDLLGCAQTGTGKTAAFAMPILQRLSGAPAPGGGRPIRALVLTPTRELALQIDESFADYGRHLRLSHCVIFGGVSQNPQVEQLKRGVDILTATPGRLNDLIGQGYIDLGRVEVFVLDEADRMLDMGFVHDVKRVITHLPPRRQTLLFSATMPREIEELAGSLLHDPQKVMVTPPATTVESIRQSVYFVDKGNKRHLLAKLLQSPEVTSALVFTRTKHGADRVVRDLARAGIGAKAIHGNKSQNARQDALGQFKSGAIRVLVATDIAARGIDVSGLSHVFNYDLPNIPETYVHRIGRTGRAGHAGTAISFCDQEEQAYLADIEKLTRIHIPPVKHEWPMQQTAPSPAPQAKPARPTPAAARQRKGGPSMEEKHPAPRPQADASPAADAAQGTPGKKRRRRGRRRAAQDAQAAAQSAPQTGASRPAAPEKSASQTRRSQAVPEAAATPEQAAQTRRPKAEPNAARAAQQKPPRAGEKPRAARRPERTAAEAPAPQADLSAVQDDSLQVIPRRATTQKYASFADYIKAHE